jgi:hypothetical protein
MSDIQVLCNKVPNSSQEVSRGFEEQQEHIQARWILYEVIFKEERAGDVKVVENYRKEQLANNRQEVDGNQSGVAGKYYIMRLHFKPQKDSQ